MYKRQVFITIIPRNNSTEEWYA